MDFTLYRDIIYGNNKEIDRKFRPYYLLESKQYQKVPLTISNVFLNTKLDASVIKQTIISSLGEDGGKIELKRYTAHLKDFERDLSDIKRWTEKDTEKLAGKISGSFNRLNLIDTERQETASKLGFTADKISTEKPEKERRRDELSARQTELQNYQNLLSQQFESVKTDFNQKKAKFQAKSKKPKKGTNIMKRLVFSLLYQE